MLIIGISQIEEMKMKEDLGHFTARRDHYQSAQLSSYRQDFPVLSKVAWQVKSNDFHTPA